VSLAPDGAVLRLSHFFAAPRERVFAAWTDPRVLERWWTAAETWEQPQAEVDLRPGGRYRLSMLDRGSGAVETVAGEYKEVRRPERLAYTWTWEGDPELMRGSEATLVVVEFLERENGTEVVLTHRGFADNRIRDLHAGGWAACLASLERNVLGREEPA
jgi:uncharacterized protein YndB with AHSA1/START domain